MKKTSLPWIYIIVWGIGVITGGVVTHGDLAKYSVLIGFISYGITHFAVHFYYKIVDSRIMDL